MHALDEEGFPVRCLVRLSEKLTVKRPLKQEPEVAYADLLEPDTLPEAMEGRLDELSTSGSTFRSSNMPTQAAGVGLNEAPRGALGHWIVIDGQKIGNYQMVVPSTWNLGPRCAADRPGPVEAALIGTPVADPERPVEILRLVHSFDPCIACAVHVIDTKSDKVYKVRAV